MAAATNPPATMREAGLGPMVLSGVLAVGAVSGLLLALSVGGFSSLGGGIDVADGDLAEAAIGQTSESDTRSSSEVDPTTTTVTSSVTSTSVQIAPPVSPESDLELWSTTRTTLTPEEVLLRTYGVFASPNVDARIASYLVDDGIIVTSAAAVSGRDTLWLQVAGRWMSASVAMADPYTDVAVLETAEALPEALASSTVVVGRPEPGEKVSVGLGPTGGELVREAGQDGYVAALDQPVKTSLNRTCYEVFTTSVRSSDAPPGSVLVDAEGTALGMALSTLEPTAAAVPMATVVEVAHSMMEVGSPAAVWLGIEAGSDADGRTRVIDVETSGPASAVLMADDVIISIDGRAVENPDHLVHLVRSIGSDEATVVIERDGITESVNLRPVSVAAKR